MKSVLISIQPEWCEKIVNGEKTIEVRKTAPKETPFKGYIYCTKAEKQNDIIWEGAFGDRGKWNGHIIGEFVCDEIVPIILDRQSVYCPLIDDVTLEKMSQLDLYEIEEYLNNKNGYGWHISDLKIYDKPKELSEFKIGCKGCNERDTYHCKFYCYGERPIIRPPQSYMFVKELQEEIND